MTRLLIILLSAGALAAVVMLSVSAGSRDSSNPGSLETRRARSQPRTSSPSSFPTMDFATAAATTSPSTQPVAAVSTSPSPTTRRTAMTAPTTQATAGPRATPTPPVTLPAEFAILQTRSPFGRGAKRAPPSTAAGPEASFVLKGVVDVAGRLTAFVEEVSAKRVLQLSVGDALARGKVKSVTLDAIEYDAAGSAKRIEVGQNLMGQVVPPTPASKPAGPPGAPGQPGQPGQPGMPPGAVPGRPGGPMPGQPVPAPVPGH